MIYRKVQCTECGGDGRKKMKPFGSIKNPSVPCLSCVDGYIFEVITSQNVASEEKSAMGTLILSKV